MGAARTPAPDGATLTPRRGGGKREERSGSAKALPFKGRVGWGWCGFALQVLQYHFDDSLDVVENLVIPEPQYRESALLQESVPDLIGVRVRMLSTVRLYYKFLLETDEIEDIAVVGGVAGGT